MGLHLHSAACEAWLTEPDDDGYDPLAGVEFPRDRKPWTRDRYSVRSAMNGAINRRCWANAGDDGQTRDHSRRFAFLNMAHYEISRFRWESQMGKHQAWRNQTIACLRRYVLAARDFDKPPLPALPGKHLGWEIDRDFLGHWRAVHPSFDGESNTVQLTALTRRDLIAEIDLWIEENEAQS